MARARRITANLPEELLSDAMKVTRKGITETLVEGLRLGRRVVTHFEVQTRKTRLTS